MEEILFDDWANSYDESIKKQQSEFPFKGYVELLTYIAKQIKPTSKILDLGCGTAEILNYLQDLEVIYTGIDSSSKMLQRAREKFGDIQLILSSIDDLENLELDIYNNIISTYYFHHHDQQGKIEVLKNILRYLNPGGTILISDIPYYNKQTLSSAKDRYRSYLYET